MNKIATVSFAVLMLGSSAALAQPYGYGPYNQPYGYGPPPPPATPYSQPYGYGPYGPYDAYNQYGEHYVCGRNLAHIVNYIIDPATGRAITQAEYQARYPWTNTTTWTYDCTTNLWTDHTAEANSGYNPYYPQAQDYGPYRDRDRH